MTDLLEKLDSVPRRYRILPAILGLIILLISLSHISLPTIHINLSEVYKIIILISILPSIFILKKFPFRKYLSFYFPRHETYSNDLTASENSIYFKAYEVYPLSKDEEKINNFMKILEERASRGLANYITLSFISRNSRKSLVIIASDNKLSVDMEKEIFLTMISSLGLARLEEVQLSQESVVRILNLSKSLKEREEGLNLFIFSNKEYIHTSKTYDIVIGETLDTPTPIEIGLQLSDISSHVAIFGSTGSGKSTTASILSCKLWKELGLPVLVLDWTGEYEKLFNKIKCRTRIKRLDPLEGGFIVDPLKIGIKDPDLVSEILGKALGLSWPQMYMLTSILTDSAPLNLEELVKAIDSYPEDSKWDREVKRGLQRRVGILAKGQGLQILRSGLYNPLENEWGGILIFDLSNIRLSLLRRAYALLLLSAFYVTRLDKRKSSSQEVFIVVDEAHNIFDPSDIPFTDTLIAESRKLGLWLGIITQSPSSISNSVLLNTNTKIIHAIRSSRDKLVIIDTLNLKKQYVELIDKLSPGEAILAAPSLGEPIPIRVKLV